MPHRLSRFLWLFLIGALLTPLAGYAGAFILFPFVFVWLMQLLLLLTGVGISPLLILKFFVPAFYGIKWAWPTTCLIFPMVGAYWKPANMLAPFLMPMLGIVCGFVTIFIVAVFDPHSIPSADRNYFLVAGSGAGAIVGAAFGFSLWRIDAARK